MGLRCLLGHDFDEPETERERNEEGNEVVVTVREVKTCKRCGETQVVSENKEITSIDQLRESATGEPAGSTAPTEAASGSGTEGGAADWAADELDVGGDDAASTTPETVEAEPTDVDPVSDTEADEDPIDRGVADIIEQAEKDDDMLDEPSPEPAADSTDAESGAESAEEDDVPVHPGQRGTDDEDVPDAESDDGVILEEDEAFRPEEARRQWEEEATPEEVPGEDPSVGESETPDTEDAEIIDAGSEATNPEPELTDEPESTDSTGSSTTLEDEDAEIVGTESVAPESEPDPEPKPESEPDPEPKPESEPDPEPKPESEPETTDEGHMPWPEAPGDDEGHDATTPDGEPADVDFGGGLTPTDTNVEESPTDTNVEESPTDTNVEESPTDTNVEESPTDADVEESPTDADSQEPVSTDAAVESSSIDASSERANGHRTDAGAESDASATPTANVDLDRSSRDAGMEYHCPECGLTRDVGNSSMRAGDICPDCRKGYITEQQKAE